MPQFERLSSEELIDLIRRGLMAGPGASLPAPEMIDVVAELLANYGTEDFPTVMMSETAAPVEYAGVDGFREALTDWTSPFEAFRLEIEEVIVKDDKLVFLARQVGTTKHGGVELSTESASVWWVRDGKVVQVVFYLDRPMGLKAAGISAPSG